MGPKKADNTNKGRRPSQTALVPTEDQGYYYSFFYLIYF